MTKTEPTRTAPKAVKKDAGALVSVAAKTAPGSFKAVKNSRKEPKDVQESVQTFKLPVDVADWIEQAESRLRYQAGEITRLKEDNVRLKREHLQMQHRVLGTSRE